MESKNIRMLSLSALFVALMSLPWLVPHLGFLALGGLVPLLMMEQDASEDRRKHFFRWYFGCFLAWNLVTTFWVCNATVGGGLFASLANALQMSVIFAIFRFSRRHVGHGPLPYLLLATLWIAWERAYFNAEISWPWLAMGGAFATSIELVQWYEFTGILGGSLWVWASNLLIFDYVASRSYREDSAGRGAVIIGSGALIIFLPICISRYIFDSYVPSDEGELEVALLQPNFDPYEKFESLSQGEQNAILLDLADSALGEPRLSSGQMLLLAPETFTSDVNLGNISAGRTWNEFKDFLTGHEGVSLLFGASTYDYHYQHRRPGELSRQLRDGLWVDSHNSAILMDGSGRTEVYHKSKLVVGTEKTPYPKIFVPIDDALGGVMGRCIGQDTVSLLHAGDVPLGCAVCYESVYGDFCRGYVREGAGALAVITNDAWWGDTPGYRQHLSYSSLRAIELRRDIARCANTGISAFIDQRGVVTSSSSWWKREVLRGKVALSSRKTFFVRHGDIAGIASTWAAALLLALVFALTITKSHNNSNEKKRHSGRSRA